MPKKAPRLCLPKKSGKLPNSNVRLIKQIRQPPIGKGRGEHSKEKGKK